MEETYEIGLVQYKEHTALNSLREAFMGRLEEWGCDESQVKIDYQNAGGDPAQAAEICSGFVQQEVDMIVAIATPAAQAAITAAEGTGVTVLFTWRGRGVRLGPGGRPEGHRRGLPHPGEQPGGFGCPKRQRPCRPWGCSMTPGSPALWRRLSG